MISFLNAAHDIRQTRSWLKVRLIALGLSLLISTLILTALFMLLVGSHFVGWLRAELELHPLLILVWKALQWPIVLFFIAQSCSLIYYCGLDLKERRRWHWFTPGAAFGGFIWLVASFGFRVYLHFFGNYSVSYGSLGAVMILLLWLYVTGLAFLIGAEINAGIELAVRAGEVGVNGAMAAPPPRASSFAPD
jgi:membrane protein